MLNLKKINRHKKNFGSNYKTLSKEENQTVKSLRRSLVASKNLSKGSRIDKSDIMIKRPGTDYPSNK